MRKQTAFPVTYHSQIATTWDLTIFAPESTPLLLPWPGATASETEGPLKKVND
jgi:hypothetical protein